VPLHQQRTASSDTTRSNLSATTKRCRIVGDNPEGSNIMWHLTSRHRTSEQRPAAQHLSTDRTGGRHASCERSATHLTTHYNSQPDHAATFLGSTPRNRTAHSRRSHHAVQNSRSESRLTFIFTTIKQQLTKPHCNNLRQK